MKTGIFLVALLAAGACAARQTEPRQVDELMRQLDSLRRQSERDQRTIQSLESRVFLCEDRLETAEVVGRRAVDSVPRLPVTKKSRAPEVEDDGPIPSPEPPDDFEPEEVEVVYEGEAARDAKPRRVIRIHESTQPDEPVAVEVAPGDPVDDPASFESEKLPVVPLPDVPPPAPPAAPPAARGSTLDPLTVYKSGYEALKQRDHATAIATFLSFVQLWPDHDYADNAQYWLGEAHYDRKNYKVALVEFRKVVRRYPDGNKAPDALLKIGFCHAQLAEIDAARDVLSQVVEIYPKTDAARLAAKRLEELKR